MAKDPKRDDTMPEPVPATKVITGVHRKEVLKKLETLAPTPSMPPRDEPGGVLQYMLALAQMHRSDAAYAAARADEAAQALTAELDDVRSVVLILDGKLSKLDERVGRLDDRVATVVNAQIVQGSQITGLQKEMTAMQMTFEGALTGFDARLAIVTRRVDQMETSFAQFRELVMADVDVRRRQLAFDEAEAKNGSPETPSDPAGSTEGSGGKR